MNELIKSEAEKYEKELLGDVKNIDIPVIKSFTAGFNRCLELAKMDNEEAYSKWWNDLPVGAQNTVKSAFLAAAKLKDVEIMELKDWVDKIEKANIEKTEKLQVAVMALGEAYELIRSTGYTIDNNNGNRCMDGNEYIWIDRGIIVMKEALEKIKGEK